jgi:hypothetical protein
VAAKEMTRALLASGVLALIPVAAQATPSTTYWAPSTASCQARGVPHVTYDTYFWKGPPAGAQGAPGYPIDTGVTTGFLPFNKVQGEVGFDVLLPSEYRSATCRPARTFSGPGVLARTCTSPTTCHCWLARYSSRDKNLQPGGTKYMWTAQLDIDIPLGR